MDEADEKEVRRCQHGEPYKDYCHRCAASRTQIREDLVNKPPHYNQGSIECIDAIHEALTQEEFTGYCKGNAVKYLWRSNLKGGLEDLKKAQWYLNKLIASWR